MHFLNNLVCRVLVNQYISQNNLLQSRSKVCDSSYPNIIHLTRKHFLCLNWFKCASFEKLFLLDNKPSLQMQLFAVLQQKLIFESFFYICSTDFKYFFFLSVHTQLVGFCVCMKSQLLHEFWINSSDRTFILL